MAGGGTPSTGSPARVSFCSSHPLRVQPPKAMAAELIRLDRPPADFCVSVSGLSPTLEVPKLERYLRELGGPLWSLIVHEDNTGGDMRRWAMAFFYCESDAERCRQQCDGLVLAGRRLSTRRLTKLRGSNHPAAGREGIPASKAIDLMNHYVGFNGWSSELLHVQPAVDGDHAAGTTSGADLFMARARITVADGPEVTAEAIGGGVGSRLYAESSTADDAARWERRAQHKKAAVTGALKAALAKLCIIRMNGRVIVRAIEQVQKQQPSACHQTTPTSATSSRKRPLERPLASHAPVAPHSAALTPMEHLSSTMTISVCPRQSAGPSMMAVVRQPSGSSWVWRPE